MDFVDQTSQQHKQPVMVGNGGMYAVRRRKRPAQKMHSGVDQDDAKSNPSKRHRGRLNGELDKLAALLPFSEDVRGRLDKLSVLRLSVGYLKVKTFLHAGVQKNEDSVLFCNNNERTATSVDGVNFSEGDLLLQALNGFVLVVSADGCILYTSSTVQEYLGFHQSDLVHQSIYELIHVDDRAMFQSQLHFSFNPKCAGDVSVGFESYRPQHLPLENSAFLERNFCCRFRCFLNNSSGFLALNFQGRLKYLHGEDQTLENSSSAPPELNLFAIASPVQPPGILEIRTKTLIFQTKHKLDFAPLSIDTRGKMVLGYTEMELCTRRSGYQFIHAADMMYCADNHLRMIKTGESGFTVFRLLTKNGVWVWVQANARLVFKGDKPDFIIARQKPLTNEEGEEHLRRRQLQLPFNFAGEAVLYESYEMPETQYSQSKSTKKSRSTDQKGLDPQSLLGSLLKQEHSAYILPREPETQYPLDQAFVDSHALLSVPSDGWRVDSLEPSFNQTSMLTSLEKILGKEGTEGALKSLEVDRVVLKEWEDAILRIHQESGDGPAQLNDILANDVFSYVEEALLKETDMKGYKQSRPKRTYMRKEESVEASPNKPMELFQNCTNPNTIHQKQLFGHDASPNLKPRGYGLEGRNKLERTSMNASGPQQLHSNILDESHYCVFLPQTTAVTSPYQPESDLEWRSGPSIQKSLLTDFGSSDVFQSGKQNPMSDCHGQSHHPLKPGISQQQVGPQILSYGQKDHFYHHPTATQHIQQGQPHLVFKVQDTISHGQTHCGLLVSTTPQNVEDLHSDCKFKTIIAGQIDSQKPPV